MSERCEKCIQLKQHEKNVNQAIERRRARTREREQDIHVRSVFDAAAAAA